MSAIRPILLRTPFRIYVAGGRSSPGIFLRLLHHEPTSKPFPTSPSSSNSNPAVSFFETSCGLSPSAAVAAALKTNIKTIAKAESVLDLLRSYGFTEPNIALFAAKQPVLFIYHPEKSIKPKLDLFVSSGFTANFIVKLFSKNPSILTSSLKKLSLNLHMLMTILHGDRKSLATSIARFPWILMRDLKKTMSNIETLRERGVTDANIAKLIKWWPRAMAREPFRFSKTVASLEDMGFDPSSTVFLQGISVIHGLTPSNWERKLQLYRSLGWSQEETLSAFKKYPMCMSISEEKARKVVAFFVENLKWEPSYLALQPNILGYSLEKRIIPRYDFFNIVSTSELALKNISFPRLISMAESDFVKKYLCKYGDKIPKLLEAYKVKLDMTVAVSSNFVL